MNPSLTHSVMSFPTSYNNSPTSNPLLSTVSEGISLDDFLIKKVIGRGSFGKVYMVKKKSDGAIYAMKTLKKDFVIRTKQVSNTKVERDIMQMVNHPFVVKLHFAFQNPEKLYFVCDFLNGGELFYHLCN